MSIPNEHTEKLNIEEFLSQSHPSQIASLRTLEDAQRDLMEESERKYESVEVAPERLEDQVKRYLKEHKIA